MTRVKAQVLIRVGVLYAVYALRFLCELPNLAGYTVVVPELNIGAVVLGNRSHFDASIAVDACVNRKPLIGDVDVTVSIGIAVDRDGNFADLYLFDGCLTPSDLKRRSCRTSVVALADDGNVCGSDFDVVAVGGCKVRTEFERLAVERDRGYGCKLRAGVVLGCNADARLRDVCGRDGERPASGAGVVAFAGYGCLGGARMLIVGI